MYLTVFLGCLVGIVVVAQTLYTSTMEHLKEFGTVKAIGGSNARHLPDPRQAGLDRGGRRLRARRAHVLRACGRAIAKIDLKLIIPPTFVAIVFVGTVLMCLGGGDDLVPQGRVHRPGARVPRLTSARTRREARSRSRSTSRRTFREGRGRRVTVLRGVSLDARAAARSSRSRARRAPARRRSSRSSAASSRRPRAASIVDGEEVDPRQARAPPGDPQAVDRVRLPAVQPLPVPDGARERRVRAERQGRRRAAARAGGRARPRAPSGLVDRLRLPAARPLGRPEAARRDRPGARRRSRRSSSPTSRPPTSTRTSGSQVLEMFRDLAKQENRALLIVTHDPKVRSIADRVAPDPRRRARSRDEIAA